MIKVREKERCARAYRDQSTLESTQLARPSISVSTIEARPSTTSFRHPRHLNGGIPDG